MGKPPTAGEMFFALNEPGDDRPVESHVCVAPFRVSTARIHERHISWHVYVHLGTYDLPRGLELLKHVRRGQTANVCAERERERA